jgi:hypothetical protein
VENFAGQRPQPNAQQIAKVFAPLDNELSGLKKRVAPSQRDINAIEMGNLP